MYLILRQRVSGPGQGLTTISLLHQVAQSEPGGLLPTPLTRCKEQIPNPFWRTSQSEGKWEVRGENPLKIVKY